MESLIDDSSAASSCRTRRYCRWRMTPHTGDRHLGSLSLLRVVAFWKAVRDHGGRGDLLPQNFAGVNTICAYLRAREPGRQEAAHG